MLFFFLVNDVDTKIFLSVLVYVGFVTNSIDRYLRM